MNLKRYAICVSLTAGAACQPVDTVSEADREALRGARASARIRAPRPSTPKVRAPVVARPCRQDVLFVDVPVHSPLPWSSLGFLGDLERNLENHIAATNQSWFCPTANCVVAGVDVVATSALPERNETFRDDGHLRFVRVRFEDPSSGQPLRLRDEAQCAAVAQLRAATELIAAVPGDAIYVGRECDAKSMSYESDPTDEMALWHLDRLGVERSAAQIAPPLGAPLGVDLALVDSGVDPAVASAVGMASDANFVSGTGLHEHGSGMAVFARQLAPQAALHSLRALDAKGSGTGEELARALDAALYAGDPTRPLVIDLSLGWPAPLSRVAPLQGPGCTSWEDPFGEPVRYLLDVARRTDEAGVRRTFVSAAAGNRALDTPPGLFPSEPTGAARPSCGPPVSASPDLYYPGQYANELTCRDGAPGARRLSTAVAAVDALYRPAVGAIPGAETALVAPGQHVIATLPVPSSPLACVSGSSFPPPVRMPSSFSGSSVAAVSVAAAAARAQAARITRSLEPLSATSLERLLYLTGEDVCRFTPDGARVRRLHVGRLDHALGEDRCAPLVACAQAQAGLDAGLVATCGEALVGCGLEPGDHLGNPLPGCIPEEGHALTIPERGSSLSCTTQRSAQVAPMLASACGSSCPDDGRRDPHLIGSFGPQPNVPTCPWCSAELSKFPIVRVVLKLDLNPDFAPSTTLSNPWLRLEGSKLSDGTPQKIYIDLSLWTSGGDWQPGAHLAFELEFSPLDLDPETATASLLLDVLTPGAKWSATDTSALVLGGE